MKTAFVLGLLSLSLATVVSGRLLGSQKCTWGPSYWCQGFAQSRECSATKHCIRNVWSQQDLPADNDDVCTICKNMVKEARDTLESDEVQMELKQVFDGSCALIPLRVIADECKKLSDQFIPELIETLASEMNPQLVCATAGLCNSERIDLLLYQMNNAQNKPKSECDMCKVESKAIGDRIRSAGKDVIADKLFEICGHFSSYSDACRMTVLDNFELIHNVLIHADQGVCHLSGMCSETFKNVPARYTSTNPEDIQCEFCEKVIQHWVDTWTANTTQDEFKEVLEAICHKLGSSDRVQHCLHIVDDYYLPWFHYLMNEVNPRVICSMAGLCGQGEFLEIDPHTSITLLLPIQPETPMIKLTPAHSQSNQRMTGMEESLINGQYAETHRRNDLEGHNLDSSIAEGRLIGGYFAPQTVIAADKPGCVICEYALHELQDFLSDVKTEAKVEEALEKICHMMPSSVEDQCDHFVETYGPAIVQMVIHDIDPSEICSRLQLCSDNLLKQQASVPMAIQLLKKNDDTCALCEYVMTTIDGMIVDKNDQRMIVNLLDSICYKFMPHSISNECEKYVSEYTPIILELLAEEFTPDQICRELSMCSDKAVIEEAPKALALTKQDEKCIFCEFAMTKFDQILRDPYNDHDIASSLISLCAQMPSNLERQCQKWVHKNSKTIVSLISTDVAPWLICPAMVQCPDVQMNVDDGIEVTRHELGDERPYCTLCEYAIGEVDKLIEDKENEQQIVNALDRICYMLTAPIQKECLSLVTTYTDEIIKMFVAQYTPEQVCSALHLCAKPSTPTITFANDVASYHANAIPPMEEQMTEEELQVSEHAGCVLCEFAVTILEKEVLTNRSIDMAKRGVQMVCSYMPETIAEKCEQFVDEYGDEIVELIINTELDPKVFCTELALCSPTQEKQALFGGQPCIWGPAFWCQSLVHAQACGTTKHCQELVWNKN